MFDRIPLDSIDKKDKRFVVKKDNHIVNGQNHSRSVFYDAKYY